MGIRGVPLSLPRLAALVLAFGLGATTPYLVAQVAGTAASATGDVHTLAGLPAQQAEMGARPDCW